MEKMGEKFFFTYLMVFRQKEFQKDIRRKFKFNSDTVTTVFVC